MAGRPHFLEHPTDGLNRRRRLAELIVAGETRDTIAGAFGVHPDTITRWKDRADVQQLITKMNRDRINRIVSKVDADLDRRLAHIQEMELEDVLKLRRELVPHKIEIGEPDADAAAQELLSDYLSAHGLDELTEDDEEDPDDDADAEVAGELPGPS